jgi:TetR/AcrR family transcriptional repressor of nem operon
MNKRAEQKQQSLDKILSVTARRLREEGIKGASIVKVMNEAGLTHGAFYSHFDNKDELAQAGFQHAIETAQPRWFRAGKKVDETFAQRLKRLAAGYLNRRHRDSIGSGCAISALANDVPNASEGFQTTYEQAVRATCQEISEGHPDKEDDAIAFLSLCVGSLLLSRNVSDEALSEQILDTARKHIERNG